MIIIETLKNYILMRSIYSIKKNRRFDMKIKTNKHTRYLTDTHTVLSLKEKVLLNNYIVENRKLLKELSKL